MMQLIKNPAPNTWAKLSERPVVKITDMTSLLQKIFKDVQKQGDTAVKKYTKTYDKVALQNLKVSAQEIMEAETQISPALKKAIKTAHKNIYTFHVAQREKPQTIETCEGVHCWRENRAIEHVGLYIPGGTAPLFSTVLMLGVPADIAGCKEIILCTPPDENGRVHPAILYTAKLVGVTSIFKVGGVQAIAALTFGTQTIPRVDKIFGPGNQYVTAAKQFAQYYGVAIDMPAGPSEVLVIADASANAEFVAADLLSQAEHGVDSQVILLSDNEKIIAQTLVELDKQLHVLPRKKIAQKAIKNSKAILLKDIKTCVDFSNIYAPEHLILAVDKAQNYRTQITCAGSVFMGHYTCESAGDYASGTNHTLPTNAHARNYSGVSLDSFVKKITFQKISKKGMLYLSETIEIMAESEHLHAHKNAVSVRLKTLR